DRQEPGDMPETWNLAQLARIGLVPGLLGAGQMLFDCTSEHILLEGPNVECLRHVVEYETNERTTYHGGTETPTETRETIHTQCTHDPHCNRLHRHDSDKTRDQHTTTSRRERT